MLRNIQIPILFWLTPVIALLSYIFGPADPGAGYLIWMGIGLIGAVLCGVHHAEVIAHKVGEPFGTLILALAITIIEVAIILAVSSAGGPSAAYMARDTVFAAVMILITGVPGICMLLGSIRHAEQEFSMAGVSAALVTLSAIAVLCFVLPNYLVTESGPVFSDSQLLFVSIVTLILYLTFVFVQTIKHRSYFLPKEGDKNNIPEPPNNITAWVTVVFLFISLAAVVLLAKGVTPALKTMVANMGAPATFTGVIIAFVILLPESLAAIKNARKDALQVSMNLALGSALATIGLTIPVVAIFSLTQGQDITLGIDQRSMVLMVLSLFCLALSLRTGRTTIMQGVVLLVLFGVYIFTSIIP